MAERMSPTEFKLWRDRLACSKRAWTREGLIGTGHASTMRILIAMNRGDQWSHLSREQFGGLGHEMWAVVNKVFPIGKAIMGEVASKNPKVQVFPRSEDSVKSAIPVEHLINYDIEELNFKRQTNLALSHNLYAPLGLIEHGFTPEEEIETEGGRRMSLYRPAKPDRPWIKARPIWNVLLDCSVDTFHVDEGLGWCAFRDIERLDDIRDNPNMINRDDLKNFAGNVSPEWQEMRHDFFVRNDDPDREQYVEVFRVYDARERKWFQMTLDGVNKPLREPADWPIDWETLPLSVLQVNEQMDTPIPLSIMDQAVPIQQELNRLRTMMGQLVYRLRRIIAYQRGGIEEGELAKLEVAELNELIGFKGNPKEMLQMITSGVFPQELLQYNALLEEDMREAMGQSKMGRAQRINVETATEVERVQQGQDIATATIVEAFENFNSDVIRLYMQGRRATMDITGDEIVRIVGQQDANGVQQWGTVSPGDLHGDFDFHVVHGSTRPKDRAREAQLAGADLQIAQNAPDIFKVAFFARQYLEARGIEPTRGMTDEALTASAVRTLDAVRRNAQVGDEAPAGGTPPAVALAQTAGGGGALQ